MPHLDHAHLPPEIAKLLLLRGAGTPPLEWNAVRAAKQSLDAIAGDADLFRGVSISDDTMAGAVRALLYLWNGWPAECVMHAQAVPDPERAYLEALAARQQGDTPAAKSFCHRLGEHPIFKPLADDAIKSIGQKSESPLQRFRSILEMGETWEPHAFLDLREQARAANKVGLTGVELVCELQRTEFEMLFAYCYRSVTGRDATRPPEEKAKLPRKAPRPSPSRRKSTRTPPPTSRKKVDPAPPAAPPTMLKVRCPKCTKTMPVPSTICGRAVNCINCGTAFMVPKPKATAASSH